ncbi:MAG: VOC family protein [bacterium]|nr:VOC family protein [bacterium]
MNIRMTSIYVDDPVKAFKFYTEILGFQEVLYMPEAQLAIVSSKEHPHGTALLLEPNSNPIAKTYQDALYSAGLPVIVFGSENVQKEYDELSSLGIKFKSLPAKSDFGTTADFDDTCGNYIRIHQH